MHEVFLGTYLKTIYIGCHRNYPQTHPEVNTEGLVARDTAVNGGST
jgi:hypothetical protein